MEQSIFPGLLGKPCSPYHHNALCNNTPFPHSSSMALIQLFIYCLHTSKSFLTGLLVINLIPAIQLPFSNGPKFPKCKSYQTVLCSVILYKKQNKDQTPPQIGNLTPFQYHPPRNKYLHKNHIAFQSIYCSCTLIIPRFNFQFSASFLLTETVCISFKLNALL